MINEDIKPGYAPEEITFKSFTTQNFHHAPETAKAFQDTIDRVGADHPKEVMTALKATDMYMKLNDMHLAAGVPPDQQEVNRWKLAHNAARDALLAVGEFAHHQDYWHRHEHELQDMLTKYNLDTAGAEMSEQVEETHDWGNMSRREFKRRELEHELGHETRGQKPNQPKYYHNVPFAKKDYAKKEGMRFDSDKKKWYHSDSHRSSASQFPRLSEEVEQVDEAGAFSYGYKAPRKGSVAYNAMMKRKEQEKKTKPIEPKDQMVGTAKVTKEEAEQIDELNVMDRTSPARRRNYVHPDQTRKAGETGELHHVVDASGKTIAKYKNKMDAITHSYKKDEYRVKSMKEEVEQVDEISSDTAKSYLDKVRFKQAKRVVKANMGAPREKPLAAAALDRTAKSMELARKRVKEEVELSEEMHRVNATVSDPNHQAVTMRKEKIQKTARVRADSKEHAIHKVTQYYKDRGYKVHDAEHVGMVNEELTDKTIRSSDKVKVARVIADMLGVDKAESMSPEQAVAAGLRNMRTKRMTPELVGVVRKMLDLAQTVGIKVDKSMLPKAVSEAKEDRVAEIDPSTDYNAARGILNLTDFLRSKKMNGAKGVGHTLHDEDGTRKMKVKYHTEEVELDEDVAALRKQLDKHTELAIKANRAGDDEVTKKHQGHINKIKEKMAKLVRSEAAEEVEIEEDMDSADYKINPETGRKYRAHKINFKNSGAKGKLEQDDYSMKEEVDHDDIDDKELDNMADTVDHEDDVLDHYDDDELTIVDCETGEECEEEGVNEESLNEVLSRSERMKARIRFMRTQSKRQRRLQIVLKRRSDTKTLTKRARRLAISMLKQRIMKKPASQLTVSEKERAEAIISKKKALIDRLAMRLVPRVRKIENDRLSHPQVTKE